MIEPMTLFPTLVTEDLAAQKAFYESSFGFRAVFFDPDFYLHLLHERSGAQLGFLVPAHSTQPAFLHTHAGRDGMVIAVEVADVRTALDAAERMALELAMDYRVEPWGQKHFMVRDPAGFVVDVIEHETP